MKKKVFSKSMAWILSVAMIFGLFIIAPMTATAISPSDVAQIAIDAAKVEQAIQWAIDIANDDSHGYGGGWGPEYDCSSFVISAFKSAGIDTGNATYTQNMVPEMTAKNFTYISWSDLGGKSGLQRGDILWRQNPGHTEIYIGNNQQVGSHQDLDGKKGDSSGKEISVQEYYEGGGGWDGILRYGLGGGGSYTTSYNPQGVLDCIDSPETGKLHVRGWAFDKDDPNTQIEVHVYVGGIPGSGAPGYGIVANTERQDVNAAYSVGDYHGFDATFDVSPIGTQTVYLYAINIGGGNNVEIGKGTVNIEEKPSYYIPQGTLEGAISPEAGKLYIAGWAFDRDDVNASLGIHIYVGGTFAGEISACKGRADVGSAFPGVGDYHGFEETIDVSQFGTQTVDVYAINVGGGSNIHIGSVTVNIAEKPSDIYVPVMQEAYVDNVTPYSFRLNAKVSDNVGVSRVEFETWKDGSPLRKTYTAQPIGNDMYIYDVNISDLTDEAGVYHSIVHAYDPSNNHSTAEIYIIVPDKDIVAPIITDVTVSQVTSKGYRVTCRVSDNVGVTSVRFPTWTPWNDGQDDLIWHDGTISGNIATCYINASEHNNETGDYATHIYAYDAAGNSTVVHTGATVTDEPLAVASTIYEGHKYTVYNSGLSWTQSKEWCENNGGHLATVTSETEWNKISELLKNYNGIRCWLGAESTSGAWNWTTGEPFDYSKWNEGQPDCAGNSEFYLGTHGGDYLDNYKWNDYPNDYYSVGGFVFEKEIVPTAVAEHNGHTYEYYSDTMDWWQAYRFCEKKGGHLVTINSKEENDFLLGMTNAQVEGVWLGGKTDSNHEIWHWITGELFDYQNWDTGEPNNVNQDAIHMYILGNGKGKWDDLASSDTQNCGFICEYDNEIDSTKYEPVYKENYNGHEYWFFEDTVDWQTAKKICEAKGGHLVIIDNADEDSMVLSGIQKTSKSQAWIGATDIAEEGIWRDVNGQALTYTNWHSSQPDNWNGNVEEDYALMWSGGTWNDCSSFGAIISDVGFVCEFDDPCTGSGHDYKLTSQTPATCTTDGKKVYKCSKCGDTTTETIKATGHNFIATIVASTCIEKGYTLHTCTKCGNSYKDTYTDALGHNYEETVIAPTTTSEGYTLHTCKRCGHSYKFDIKPMLVEKLVNSSTISGTKITLGDKLTVNATASGGTGDYTYAVYYKKSSAEKWSTAQSYKANATISFKPAAAVKYDVCVKVKDSKGTIAKQYFTISVTKELVNNSTLSATTVKKGSNVTVTAKASGGTGKYTYGIYYKKATSEKWTTAQSYGTNTAVTIKPAAAVKYDICVKVKDSSGNIAKKYFTLTVTK